MRHLAVFDLDGTLVDTAPDLIDTLNHVLSEHGVSAVDPHAMRHNIGLGARHMIESTLAEAGIALPPERIDEVHGAYLTHYASRIAKLSRPFPEMARALDDLEAEGVALAVCTNKREALARQLLTELGLLARFAFVAGYDTFEAAKPDPRHLLLTVERAGGHADRTVYVGDSATDRTTARAAQIPFVGVTYGYTDVPMAELAPDLLVGPGEDVAAAVRALMPAG